VEGNRILTSTPVITAVEVISVSGPAPQPSAGPRQGQVRLLHVYDQYRPGFTPAPGGSAPEVLERLYLRIGTDQGVEGFYGPIDREAAIPVLDMFATFLIGLDPLAGTPIWDQLYRLDRHSRHGYLKMAISAVDNALWDLRGKYFDAPVHRLLGGPSRPRIPAYASTLGTSHDPDVIDSFAKELAAEGYTAQKWFLAHGPGDGAEGLTRNVRMAERVRAAVGSDTRLMFDAFMGWDLAHARAWAQEVEPLRPTWLEEPFSPTQFSAFAALRDSTRIPLSAGEHLYDRADVLPFLRERVLSVLQCDPEWCGGVTELVRICALAETFGVPVMPHGHGLHAALHVVASQSPAVCPSAEYLLHVMPARHHFELDAPAPSGGSFELPSEPGFGITLDEDKIESRRVWQPQY
jgi:L-rhamnonate dehydratase